MTGVSTPERFSGGPTPLQRLRRASVRLFACIGLLYSVVSTTPLVELWARALAGAWEDPAGDTLIVLGGSMQARDMIGYSSYLRAVYAVRLYRSGGARRLIFSGGPAESPVAVAMRDLAVGLGVPAGAVTTETDSLSTRENALFLARLLPNDPSRKVLMTSDYHVFRARRAFLKAGLPVLPHPIPDARKRATDWRGRWPAFLDLSLESVKIGYYYVRGWI